MEGTVRKKTVFVTVGTTSFDKLVETVTHSMILKLLANHGYNHILLQIGRGKHEPSTKGITGITVDYYRYKDSIVEDIANAELVISHAGAGTCLETLGASKPLLVVINEELMGNHQVELAARLHKDGHLLYCTCSQLVDTLRTLNTESVVPYEPGKPEKFASFLDKVMGIA